MFGLRKFITLHILFLSLLTHGKADENPDKNFSSFETSKNICDKCECSTYSSIFILNCSKRDLHHTLSNWPEHKNKSLRASFTGNIITTLEKFPTSDSSVFLTLDHCSIKYLAPGLFENMKNVTFVDLSYNLITIDQLSSEKFKGPANNDEFEPIEMTHLNLAYNKIHTLPKSLFEHMPRLKHLNLEGNDFKVLDLQTQAALSSIPNLEYLNVADNDLEELPDTIFLDLSKIIALDLSKNRMRFMPDALKNAGNLEVLVFDSNPIYELVDGVFNGMPNLYELSLNNLSNVVEIHSFTFRPLKKLRKLQLSNNRDFEVFEPDAFNSHGNFSLKELYLNNNDLMDIPSMLLNFSGLHIFEFNDNPMMCTCNLYNITQKLNKKITRNKAGPYCIDENRTSRQVFSLDDRVCNKDYVPSLLYKTEYRARYSLIRVSLITTSLIAIFAIFIAIVVCFAKQRKYDILGQSFLSRSTSVLYNPLNRQPSL